MQEVAQINYGKDEVVVQSGLIVDVGNTGEYISLVRGDLSLTVNAGNVVETNELKRSYNMMADIAAAEADGQPHSWYLYMAFDGRCWVVDGTESKRELNLSFLAFPTRSDWGVTGIIPS